MGLLDKFLWSWDNVEVLTSLFDKWSPSNCKSEKDYENSLSSFLHEELENHEIIKQYAVGRFHADLVIDDELIIEIKYNFNTLTKYRNLLGQLAEYKDWSGPIILLLVGKTDPDLKKRLTSHAKEEGFYGILPLQRYKVTVYDKWKTIQTPVALD